MVGSLALVTCLTVFLAIKVVYRRENSDFTFYAYGVAVTAVVTTQMLVSRVLYRDPAQLAQNAAGQSRPNANLVVTCLVAVHNELAVVEDCIRSMVGQTYLRTEVIVVDDASTDGTARRLDELSLVYPIKILKLPTNVGKKRALAAGMAMAQGQVFAFTDSDSVWAADAVEKSMQIFDQFDDVGAISGHCRALNAEAGLLTKMQDSWYEGQFSVRKAFESHFGAVTCVSGPLAIFRREAIFNYIPAWESDSFLGDEFRFATDRTLTGFVLMDEKTSRSIRSKNANTSFEKPVYPARKWRIVYSKSIRCKTVVPSSARSFIKQQVRWKKSFVRNTFFTGRFYWRRHPIPALAYYLHVLFVLAGPVVAFRHLVYLPMSGSFESGGLYLAGVALIGSVFGATYRAEDPANGHRWVYRPLMSLTSTLCLSWLLVYSIATIKNMSWSRG